VTLTGEAVGTDKSNAADDDHPVVVVCQDDFYTALSHLLPSLSAAELERYEMMRDMFTHRRHDNHQQSQQQPVTVSSENQL